MKKIVGLLILVGSHFSLEAATITAVNSGLWTTNSVWDCGCQPTKNDNIIIPSGKTITIPVLTVATLTGGPVITLTVNGTLVIDGGLSMDQTDIIYVNSGGQIKTNLIWPLSAPIGSGGSTILLFNGSPITGPASVTNGALPITLTTFKATAEEKSISLQWTSQSEENFSYYSIERSKDGINFSSIGKVKGSGNSNVTLNYSYSDEDPIPGKSYYRLTAVDLDGSLQSFKMIMAEFNPAQKDVTVYPNPVVDKKFTLQINFVPGDNDILVVRSNNGQTVYQKELSVSQTEITLPENSIGNYYVEVITSSEKLYRHVIVQ